MSCDAAYRRMRGIYISGIIAARDCAFSAVADSTYDAAAVASAVNVSSVIAVNDIGTVAPTYDTSYN